MRIFIVHFQALQTFYEQSKPRFGKRIKFPAKKIKVGMQDLKLGKKLLASNQLGVGRRTTT